MSPDLPAHPADTTRRHRRHYSPTHHTLPTHAAQHTTTQHSHAHASTPPQVAQDTKKLSGSAYTGAATFCFIEAVEKYGPAQSYAQLLMHMHETLERVTGGGGGGMQMPGGALGGLVAGLLLGMPVGGIGGMGGQSPVLCCDKQIDLYNTRINI
jgi:hypothetical protein